MKKAASDSLNSYVIKFAKMKSTLKLFKELFSVIASGTEMGRTISRKKLLQWDSNKLYKILTQLLLIKCAHKNYLYWPNYLKGLIWAILSSKPLKNQLKKLDFYSSTVKTLNKQKNMDSHLESWWKLFSVRNNCKWKNKSFLKAIIISSGTMPEIIPLIHKTNPKSKMLKSFNTSQSLLSQLLNNLTLMSIRLKKFQRKNKSHQI